MKYAMPILSLIILGSLLAIYAEEVTETYLNRVDKTSFLHKAGNKIKAGTLTLTGLKVVLDPTEPPIRRAVTGAKVACCGGFATANLMAATASFTSYTKIIASACCEISWLALSGLEYIDANS